MTALVLLHYPIDNRRGETITTAVTNMDLHDLSRSARTYEVDHYFVVNPIEEQHTVLNRMLDHWKKPTSREWHPDRFEALSRIELIRTFAEVKHTLLSRYPGLLTEVMMPDARPLEKQTQYETIRERWKTEKPGLKLIVLGTGYGIAKEFLPEVHTFGAPVLGPKGSDGYNHLSVRAAGAVILDRLFRV